MRKNLRVMGSRKPFKWALFLAGLALFASPALATDSQRRQRASAAYEKAEQMHAALEAHPESRRNKDEYKKVIDAYMQVYRADLTYGKTPAALTAVAELYHEMGREFAADSYYLECIKSYRFLMSQYPQNRISREALFTIGEVYRQDLQDPEDARKAFQEFITSFPKSDKVPEARSRLKELQQAPEKTQAHSTAAPVAPAAPAAPAPSEEGPAEVRTNGLREVTAVRRWVGPNYLRIVIGVDSEVKFDSIRLSNPDRIVLNLQNAHLGRDLMGKTFPVENGFLKQIRLAQFSADVTRVVLDVDKIETYSIFTLPNPFRLVIDVQGAAPTLLAEKTKPTPAHSAEVHKPQKTTSPAPAPEEAKTEPTASPANQEKTASVVNPPATTDSGVTTAKTNGPETGASPAVQPGNSTEAARTLTRALGLKIGRIVIDPGHGGHDTGTIGPTGLEEKDVVLDVGLKLRKLLEQNTGCEVMMTRSDDTFIPLEERTAIANEKGADLFLSIHANSSPDKSARGIETYYLNFTSSPDALEVAARENATSQEAVHQLQDLIKKIALTEKIEESQEFAQVVQREVYTRVTKAGGAQRDRGTKKAPFVVLIGANMPSVLAEISFLSNPRDERQLRRSDYREKIAYALYEGIVTYVKNLGEMSTAQRLASDETSRPTRTDF